MTQLTVTAPVQAMRPGPGRFPGIWRPLRSALWVIHVAFGAVCLVLMLAVIAAIPGLNLLALGYLLDAQRQVAISGRLRNGFPLLQLAPRVGCICFFVLLFLIPVRILATQASAALIVRAGSGVESDGLLLAVRILQIAIAIHLLLAIARGGTAGCFLRPFRNLTWLWSMLRSGDWYAAADRSTAAVLSILRPWHHFLLGLRAVAGAFCWLVIPTALLVAYSAPNRTEDGWLLLSLLGGILLIPVAAWLPLLQVHQAVTGRFLSIFSTSAARQVIRHAPFSWMLSTIVLYVLTFPLYLAKIRLLPADAFLLLTPFFIVFTYPSRLLVGWAWYRGQHRSKPAWRAFLWSARLLMLPLLAGYSLFLFLTPTISELGKAAPLENHAFLSPIPYAQWSRAGRQIRLKASVDPERIMEPDHQEAADGLP